MSGKQKKASHMDRRRFLRSSAALAAGGMVWGVPTLLRAAPAVIKIGQVEPVTGPLAVIGQTMRNAGILAVEQINQAGGIKSLGGAKLQLLLGDSESKPTVGRSEADRLIKEGAAVICGAFQSGVSMAIATLAEQRQVPFVIDVAALDAITQKGYRYTFRIFPSVTGFARKMVTHVRAILDQAPVKPKRGVVANVGDAFGKGQSGTFIKVFRKSGIPIEITDQFTYPLGVSDLSSTVAKIKAARPDILFPVTRPGDSVLLVRELYKQRVPLMAIMSPGSPGWTEIRILKDLGKLVLYAFNNTIWPNPKSPVFQKATRIYRKRYGIDLDANSGYAYTAILVVADALERAGSSQPDKLVAALRQTNFAAHPMVGGPVHFAPNGDNLGATSSMLQVLPDPDVHKRVKIVLPKSFAQADWVFPAPQLWER